jgi:glycine/D-amino acid oxidase-like deaminating enzyme
MSWLFRTLIDSDMEDIDTDLPEHCTVVILGTGPAALGTATRLAKAGRGDFVLLEPAIGVRANVRRRAQECGVWMHVRFGVELREADWDAAHSCWRLRTNRGSMTATFLLLSTEAVSGSVHGRDGCSLSPGPSATVPGFPNLFLAREPQIRLISSALKMFAAKGIREFEVRPHVAAASAGARRFHPHDYHLTYRQVERVPRPSAVGAERLAP